MNTILAHSFFFIKIWYFQGSDRVADWLKTTNQVPIEQQPAFVKTSPRGSGRHQKRTRSQDRYGLQQQQQQQQQAQQQHQYMASMSSYGHFMGNPTVSFKNKIKLK